MKIIITPVEMTDITSHSGYIAALESMTDDAALEFFGFRKERGNSESTEMDTNKVEQTLKRVANGTPDIAMKACDYINAALSDWQAKFRHQSNKAVSSIFKANDNRIAIYDRELKTYAKELKQLEKSKTHASMETVARMDDIRIKMTDIGEKLKELKRGIYIPAGMLQSVTEATALNKRAMTILQSAAADVVALSKKMTEETDFAYSTLDDKDFLDKLDDMFQKIYPGGEWDANVKKLMSDSDMHCAKIYGAFDFDGKFVLYPLDKTTEFVKDVANNGKMYRVVEKRLSTLKGYASAIKGGRECPYTFTMVCREINFWFYWSVIYSQALNAYVAPLYAMMKAYDRFNADK